MLDGDDGYTTSRRVAWKFNKSHRHVLGNIDRLILAIKISRPDFGLADIFRESLYEDSQGKMRRECLMTRDGFTLLAMRFTGDAALKWQLNFISAFNWLADQLHEREENNRLIASFDIKNRESIENGSFHGKGLKMRQVEKRRLRSKERKSKRKCRRHCCPTAQPSINRPLPTLPTP